MQVHCIKPSFLPISGSDSCIHLWKSYSKLLKVSTKHFHSKSRSLCWCTQTMRFFFLWYEFLSYARLSYSFRTPICAVKTPLFMLVGGYFSQFSLPYEVISIINQPLLLVIMYGRTALYNIWIQDSQTKIWSVIIWWWLYIFFCGQIHHKCYCMNSYTTLDNQVTATEAEG